MWASEHHLSRLCSLSACFQHAKLDGLDFAIKGEPEKG